MKNSVVVKEMLICQWCLISRDLDNGNDFVQSDLYISFFLIICETVVVKIFAGEY